MSKEVLKMALEALELVNIEFVCNGAHHAKKDRHSLDEDCPVTVRYRQAITAIKEALANHIEDNLVMVTRGDAWRKQLSSAQRNELKQIEDGTWEADRNG